jgi:hypothetical protein
MHTMKQQLAAALAAARRQEAATKSAAAARGGRGRRASREVLRALELAGRRRLEAAGVPPCRLQAAAPAADPSAGMMFSWARAIGQGHRAPTMPAPAPPPPAPRPPATVLVVDDDSGQRQATKAVALDARSGAVQASARRFGGGDAPAEATLEQLRQRGQGLDVRVARGGAPLPALSMPHTPAAARLAQGELAAMAQARQAATERERARLARRAASRHDRADHWRAAAAVTLESAVAALGSAVEALTAQVAALMEAQRADTRRAQKVATS